MTKKRVALAKQGERSIVVDDGATAGATFGVDLRWPNGELVRESDFASTPEKPDLAATYWRMLREVPPNVVALASTITTGLYVITDVGESATRQIQPVDGETTVSNGDGVDGDPAVGLADVDDVGGGTLQRTAFDAKGRKTGTSAATTDDLAEGAGNLYFTNLRADARITAAKADPDGIASLIGGKLDPGQLPPLAITETFVVASQTAMLALSAQQGDVAVRSDLQASFILTADPASTLSNWQELLVPTGVGVSSFNGRTGSVVPASGDYTAAMVGAATAAQGALADSSIQPGNAALTDAREWAATTVSQSEAEAGTATTRRAWTAQRVRQAIAAWWSGSSDKAKLDLVDGGTYTPTPTGVTNVTSAAALPCSWIRVGNSVLVSGRVDVTNTVAGTFTQVRITLPIPSNFTAGGDASGSAAYNQSATNLGAGFVSADATNDQLVLNCTPIAAASGTGIRFTVVYPILP